MKGENVISALLFILCGYMVYVNYVGKNIVMMVFFIIIFLIGFPFYIALMVDTEKANDKIMRYKQIKNLKRLVKGSRDMILKAKCPRCNKVCTTEYDESKSPDDLYYSNTSIAFLCDHCSKASLGFTRSPYFTVAFRDVEFEELKR